MFWLIRREDLVDEMEALEVFKKSRELEFQHKLQAPANGNMISSAPAPGQLARKGSVFQAPSSNTIQGNIHNLPRTASNLTTNHKKLGGPGVDNIGNTNYIFLQVTDRSGANKGMEYWIKKVRTNAATMKTYELLRHILQQQRRRHLLDITAKKTRRTVCAVSNFDSLL